MESSPWSPPKMATPFYRRQLRQSRDDKPRAASWPPPLEAVPAYSLTAAEESILRRYSPIARVQPCYLRDCPLLLSRLVEDAGFSAPDFAHVLPAKHAGTMPSGDSLEALRIAISSLLNSIEHRPVVRQPPPASTSSSSTCRTIRPPPAHRSEDQGTELRSSRFFIGNFDSNVHDARKRRFSQSWWSDWLQSVSQCQHPLQDSLSAGSAQSSSQLLSETRARMARAPSIPDEFRPAAWFWLSANGDAFKLRATLYHELCSGTFERMDEPEIGRVIRQQILVDLERTPASLFLSRIDTAAVSVASGRSAAAERLLLAYSRHRPDTGYCQGLNFIVAILLSLLDEASAFVVLCGLLERLPVDLYSCDPEKLARSRVAAQCQVIDSLAEEREELTEHLLGLELDFNLFLPRWLTCLFAPVLKPKATIRLWDYVLGAGGGAAILRMALALLCRAEEALLQATDTQEVLEVLSSVTMQIEPADVDLMLCTEWPAERLKQRASGFQSSIVRELVDGVSDRAAKSCPRSSQMDFAEDASTNASSVDQDLLLEDEGTSASLLPQ